MKKIFLAITISIYLQAVSAAEQVIHISIDGLYGSAIEILGDDSLPNFARMKDEGASTLAARTDVDFTDTLPNHTSQFTGRRVDAAFGGHGWWINFEVGTSVNLHTLAGQYITGIFDMVHDAGGLTSLFAGKDKFSVYVRSWDRTNGATDTNGVNNGKNKIDRYVLNADTATLVTDFIDDLKATVRQYAFIHIRDPDAAGHDNRWNWTVGSEYMNSIVGVDSYLGEILSFVESDINYKDSTTIILTSDHGGQENGFSHEPVTPESHIIPFYVWGDGVASGVNLYDVNVCSAAEPVGTTNPPYNVKLQPVRNGDAANLASRLLGFSTIPQSQIDTVVYLQNLDP